MAPVVLSFLNMIDNFHHYWRAYGGWSFAMEPYYNEGITKLLDDPLQLEVRKVLDPYMFKERLRMPKVSEKILQILKISLACHFNSRR